MHAHTHTYTNTQNTTAVAASIIPKITAQNGIAWSLYQIQRANMFRAETYR